MGGLWRTGALVLGLITLASCGAPVPATTTTPGSATIAPAAVVAATAQAAATATPAMASVPPSAAAAAAAPSPEPQLNTAGLAEPQAGRVAVKLSGFLYDMLQLQRAYDNATAAMARVTLGTPIRASMPSELAKHTAMSLPAPWAETIPQGFVGPLPANGRIAGPPAGCPAGAEPSVGFQTVGGGSVTSQSLNGLQTIPTSMVTVSQSDPSSLNGLVSSLVQMNDPSVTTAQGWNTALWDKLKARRTSAASLMDYQMWNASADIERALVSQYRMQLAAMGAPAQVLSAYDASSTTGWYSSRAPAASDALAKMDILARMSGSVNGTVREQRPFRIPGAGQTPIFGAQTGDGKVTWDSPEDGTLTFDVDILLDTFDAMGRAVGGNVRGMDKEKGYDVRFTFLPDGTKRGDVSKGGKVVGQLAMSVNAERFENYIDVQTAQARPLVGGATFPAASPPPPAPPATVAPVVPMVTSAPVRTGAPTVTGPPAVTGAPTVTGPPAVTGAPTVTGAPAVTGPPAGVPPGYATPPPGYATPPPGYPAGPTGPPAVTGPPAGRP